MVVVCVNAFSDSACVWSHSNSGSYQKLGVSVLIFCGIIAWGGCHTGCLCCVFRCWQPLFKAFHLRWWICVTFVGVFDVRTICRSAFGNEWWTYCRFPKKQFAEPSVNELKQLLAQQIGVPALFDVYLDDSRWIVFIHACRIDSWPWEMSSPLLSGNRYKLPRASEIFEV